MLCVPLVSIVAMMARGASFSSALILDRRLLLQTTFSSITSPFLVSFSSVSNASFQDQSFEVFRVNSDSSAALNPTLTPVSKANLLKSIASVGIKTNKGGAIWLGEHHNSFKDHMMQTTLIRSISSLRNGASRVTAPPPMAIGLEQVQVKFQQVLDDYVDGKFSADEMKTLVEWETRWQWPFEGYRPVFEIAKELNIRLIALNVNSEDLANVEKGGLPGLEKSNLKQYISDLRGFAEFTMPNQFREYVDYVIRPSYEVHKAMGLLKYTISGQKLEEEMTFRNFYSGRILWDESMASNAYRWTKENPGGLIIGLVGADHVKFVNGVVGRYSRLVGDTRDCTSIILNPTLIDTLPSGSIGNTNGFVSSQTQNNITLQLRYSKEGVDMSSPDRFLPLNTGGVMPLADYLMIG